LASKKTVHTDGATQTDTGVPELLAAIAFMSDLTPTGNTHRTWRAALLAHRIASIVAPDIAHSVFHAGLLQDVGAIGSDKHISEFLNIQDQIESDYVRSHTERGASLIGRLPDMTTVAQFVRFHHEWWNGRGYPGLRAQRDIPLGAQILRIADEAVSRGCFSTCFDLAERLKSLAPLTGRVWSQSLWETFVRSTSDAGFYNALVDPGRVAELLSAELDENPLPQDLCSDTGVELIMHVFSALTDAVSSSKEGHSLRTARFAEAVAAQMGLSEAEVRTAYRTGLIHDCGWVAVPRSVAKRPGKYSDHEFDLARGHAAATGKIFGCLPDRKGMVELGRIAASHHEWLDGSGYPRRLTAKDLHILTRVLSVADAFDSMVSIANYRLITVKCALMRLEESAGTQFDPEVVNALGALAQKGDLPESLPAAA
jgi:HD-GYP domain-containing protein (c-di-GMP phosphodiesterase class II)